MQEKYAQHVRRKKKPSASEFATLYKLVIVMNTINVNFNPSDKKQSFKALCKYHYRAMQNGAGAHETVQEQPG